MGFTSFTPSYRSARDPDSDPDGPWTAAFAVETTGAEARATEDCTKP
jgi:hypothetical protein